MADLPMTENGTFKVPVAFVRTKAVIRSLAFIPLLPLSDLRSSPGRTKVIFRNSLKKRAVSSMLKIYSGLNYSNRLRSASMSAATSEALTLPDSTCKWVDSRAC